MGPEDESRPVLPPSRFGAGYSVGGDDIPQQPVYPVYPAYPAPEPPPPSSQYPPVQYPPPMPLYPMMVPVYAPSARTNGFAIAALVCPLVFCVLFPLGIIFGHIALSQIARTGEGGRGLAIAGLVISYVLAAMIVFYFFVGFGALL